MHNCKAPTGNGECGRSIPKEWKRCGECQDIRTLAIHKESLEGDGYRDKVANRHKLALSIAKMRNEHTVNEVVSDEALSLTRMLMRQGVKIENALRKEFTHANVAPAIERFMKP